MNDEIFYDLENMLRRAFSYLDREKRKATPEMAKFIEECQRFQYDILRPWERAD